MKYTERFREMFSLPQEQTIENWCGLKGLRDETDMAFMANVNDEVHEWLKNALPNYAVSRLKSDDVKGEWVDWAAKGIESLQTRYKCVDLTQMVARINRWGKENGTRRLSAGDFVALPGKPKRFQWGYEVGIMLDAASLIFESEPVVWIPNVPMPCVMIAQDKSCALFISPMIGEEGNCPRISIVKPIASFDGFFS